MFLFPCEKKCQLSFVLSYTANACLRYHVDLSLQVVVRDSFSSSEVVNCTVSTELQQRHFFVKKKKEEHQGLSSSDERMLPLDAWQADAPCILSGCLISFYGFY